MKVNYWAVNYVLQQQGEKKRHPVELTGTGGLEREC